MKGKWVTLSLAAVLVAVGVARAAEVPRIPVKASPANEVTAAADGVWFTWAQNSRARPGHYDVFAQRPGGARIKVNARGTEAAGGGIDGRLLVYYEYKRTFAGDIRKFNLRTHRRSRFPTKVNTRYDEYHPTISGRWLLFTRYIDTTRTTAVFLFNTHTHALRKLASERGRYRYVYSGQVNGDYATWGRVLPSGQDVFLYRISAKTSTRVPRPVFAQYNPSVASDGTVYYERSGNECGGSAKLVRYPRGGPATVLYSFPVGIDGGYTYVQQRAGGSLHLFYGHFNCRNGRWDIYKVIDSYSVIISTAGSGSGTVQSSPSGISCGTVCEATFHGGKIVTLTATPDTGSVFIGWSDPSCGANTTCTFTVNTGVSLTATFDASS
jgi:hypothetical protein